MTALQQVQHLRRELERAFTAVAALRGQQAEEVTWPTSPFAGLAELAIELFAGGVFTIEEARALLGYGGAVPLGRGVEGGGLPFSIPGGGENPRGTR